MPPLTPWAEARAPVWAPDAREGAIGLLRVRPGDDGREAVACLSRIAHRVRVMPFPEGIPASIHGIVFRDAVVALHPVKMLILRQRSANAPLRWQRPRGILSVPEPSGRRLEAIRR